MVRDWSCSGTPSGIDATRRMHRSSGEPFSSTATRSRSSASCRRDSSCRPTIAAPSRRQLWTPLQMDPADTNHGSHGLYAAGRLKPGATVQQAADELHGIATRDDERRSVSGSDAVRHGRPLARGRSRRLGAPLDLAAVWRRRLPAADRLRKRRQPPAGARGSTSAGDGRARGARRQPASGAASAAHREPGADGRQRHRRPRSGVRGACASWRGGTPPTSRASAASRSTSPS